MLGQLEVVDGDSPVALGGHRQQLVLAVLLDHAGERLSVDRIIDAVWGQAPPASARRTLQSYVSRLRHVVDDDAIQTVPDGYRLDADGQLDVDRFEILAAEGRLLVDTDPTAASDLLRDALALWRGAPYGSLGDEPALRPSSRRLLERRLDVTEARIRADLTAGRFDGLPAELAALAADHPTREPLHLLWMHAPLPRGPSG